MIRLKCVQINNAAYCKPITPLPQQQYTVGLYTHTRTAFALFLCFWLRECFLKTRTPSYSHAESSSDLLKAIKPGGEFSYRGIRMIEKWSCDPELKPELSRTLITLELPVKCSYTGTVTHFTIDLSSTFICRVQCIKKNLQQHFLFPKSALVQIRFQGDFFFCIKLIQLILWRLLICIIIIT